MQPNGPWCFTAILPDGDTVITRTFIPGEEEALGSFIGRYNGKRNVYFTVNEVSGRPTKKPSKKDMKYAWFLHVDIDTPKVEGRTVEEANESVEAAQERALDALNNYRLEPTIVVNSGNGINAYWWIETPVKLDTPEAIEAVESRNRALAKHFGGDHCHNVVRIPGMVISRSR